jgi:hypothetical protein
MVEAREQRVALTHTTETTQTEALGELVVNAIDHLVIKHMVAMAEILMAIQSSNLVTAKIQLQNQMH